MRVFLLLSIATALSYAYPSNELKYFNEWLNFKVTHTKHYKNEFEEQFRLKVFIDNKRKIDEHNAKFEQGIYSYRLNMNQFGDMMEHEFTTMMNGYNMPTGDHIFKNDGIPFVDELNLTLPQEIDWRKEGAVTPVKNQQDCGSCWAFSATGSLEGQYYQKTGKLISLSEQNLIDCSKSYGNEGCDGGRADKAFKYIKDNKGLDTEDSYPYEAKDDICRYNPNTIGASDTGFVYLPENDEDALKTAIGTYGPISVAIDASHSSIQFYKSGIYDEPRCNKYYLDHGVLAVGYGTEGDKDFWLVKNSWGENWGENGYIRMIRNKNNQCGIATLAYYPLV